MSFDSTNPMQATDIRLEAGEVYSFTVTVKPGEEWKDNDLPATPEGLNREAIKKDDRLNRKLDRLERFRVARRVRKKGADWFTLMGSVGPDEEEVFKIGKCREYRPKSSGRLYLFVNDAPLFYGNNHGQADVTVKRLHGQ